MSVFWQIAPLGALFLVVLVTVWRGLRAEPDKTHNNASGGGIGRGGTGDGGAD